MASQDLKKLHDKIMEEFNKCFIEALNSEACFNFFADLMQQSVQEEVYDRYEPEEYVRRKDGSRNGRGGLLSKENYDYKVSVSGNGFAVYMRNLTLNDNSGRNSGMTFYIDEGIVRGTNFYDWKESEIYRLQQQGGFPRDFYEHMLKLIDKESERKELHNILKKEINKKSKTLKL